VSVCPTCPPSTVKRETVKMRHLESVQISGCRRSYSSGLFFFRKKPNVSKPSWQPPTKAAYVELHCIRHVERSFQLSCYTLENIYKYLAPRSRRSRRSREIHSAQKSDGGGLRGLGTNLMAFARTSGCAPAPEGERYAVCRLAGWLAFNSHPRAASFSL
jgi:hypothetical protein